MRKFLAALVSVSALTAGLLTAPVAAQADQKISDHAMKREIVGYADGSVSVNGAPSTLLAHTPWTGKRFNSQYVCAQNNIGSLWAIQQATGAFESGTNTYVIGYRRPSYGDQPCSADYADSQIILYGTYQANDTSCYIVSQSSINGRYNAHVTVAMNASAYSNSACRAQTQRRNNSISQATGNALGLANFQSAGSYTASVMNDYYDSAYNFAGGDDRTSLCVLLGICG